MNPIEILQTLPRRMQAFYSDASLHFSQDEFSGTVERKKLLQDNINIIKSQIESLEKLLG